MCVCACVCACVFVCHSAPVLPELIGGSADLTPSNLTLPTGCGDFQKATPGGRYIRFGVREHGMAAICNGIAAHGGLIPYCATFLNFTGYALGAFRHTLCWHASGARARHHRVLIMAERLSLLQQHQGPCASLRSRASACCT